MSAVAERTAVTINVERDCLNQDCAALADRLHDQLASGRYTRGCSLLALPESIEAWDAEHRTARKRVYSCLRDGYTFAEVAREHYTDDVFEINTSAERRQGQPMRAGYLEAPSFSPLPSYPCARHAVRTYGVIDSDGRLRAYTWMYRCGGLAMFSMILGHADHLRRHVMYLLVRGALEAQIQYGPGVAFYNRHDSGTDGLRFFKERVGFTAKDIDWRLA